MGLGQMKNQQYRLEIVIWNTCSQKGLLALDLTYTHLTREEIIIHGGTKIWGDMGTHTLGHVLLLKSYCFAQNILTVLNDLTLTCWTTD